MSYIREDERAFSFESNVLVPVLDAIWPFSGVIEINGIGHVLVKQNVKTEIHLFSTTTNSSFKDRLKLTMTSRGVTSSRDTKRSIGETKYERMERDRMGLNVTLEMLHNFGTLLSSFLKERVSLTYLSRGRTFRVGIDKVVAFNPGDPSVHGEPFFHIEFEDSDILESDDIYNSDFFRIKLEPLLIPLEYEDTKWLKACRFCPKDFSLTFETPDKLLDYFKKVIDSIMPAKVPLEDFILSQVHS